MEQLTCKHCGASLEKAGSGEVACPVQVSIEATSTSLFCSQSCRSRYCASRADKFLAWRKTAADANLIPEEADND